MCVYVHVHVHLYFEIILRTMRDACNIQTNEESFYLFCLISSRSVEKHKGNSESLRLSHIFIELLLQFKFYKLSYLRLASEIRMIDSNEDLSKLLRALFLAVIALVAWNLHVFLLKLKLTIQGVLYLFFCNDKKWKTPTDPGIIFQEELDDDSKAEGLEKKTVIFVRHGESTWNETFNKGERSLIVFIVGWLPNLVKALLYEAYLLLSGQVDSWFYDSPMSHYGLEQVSKLRDFLGKEISGVEREIHHLRTLRGEDGGSTSIIVSSNLRRALSTIAGGFCDRLDRRPGDKIHIVPSLQEISRNPDTLSITPGQSNVTASWIEKYSDICDFQSIFDNRCNMKLHRGNKPINTNGLLRMNEFCNFVFSTEEEAIIVGGHSIWFRSFFRTFLPYTVDHPSKSRKVVNCGVVAFTLMRKPGKVGGKVSFVIDPRSIDVVYGGFT